MGMIEAIYASAASAGLLKEVVWIIDHPRARLTEQLVCEIRTDQRSHRQLAKALGILKSAIGIAKAGVTWKHV